MSGAVRTPPSLAERSEEDKRRRLASRAGARRELKYRGGAGIHEGTQGYSTQGYTGVRRGTQRYTGVQMCTVHMGTQGAGVHRGTQGYTGRRGTHWYTGVHRGTHGYTIWVHRGTQGYTGVRFGTQGCTGVHRGTQGFASVNRGAAKRTGRTPCHWHFQTSKTSSLKEKTNCAWRSRWSCGFPNYPAGYGSFPSHTKRKRSRGRGGTDKEVDFCPVFVAERKRHFRVALSCGTLYCLVLLISGV